MAITRDQVFEAAELFREKGEDPTYITIRERLGSGSFTTISKYLREWKAVGGRQREKGEGADALEVPSEFRAVLERFGADVWRTLGAFARTEIEAARVAFEERVRERDEELERAGGAVDTLQGELDETTRERDELRADLEALRGEFREVKGRSRELEASLTHALDEKLRFQEEMRQLDRTLTKVRERVTMLEVKIETLTSESLSLEEDLTRRVDELARMKEERDAARGEVLAATRVEENLRRELSKEEGRGQNLAGKVDELFQRLTEEAAKRAALEERLSTRQDETDKT
jgi:chromosome segregation ATPase